MGVSLHVLMIEDSEDDAALLVRELQRGNYEVQLNVSMNLPLWNPLSRSRIGT